MPSPRQIEDRHVKISKYLSKHLRHQPQRLGLELQPGGWVRVDELLAAMAKNCFLVSVPELHQVVYNSDKQRFAFDSTGELIRANQGHSIPVDLQLQPQIPPSILYHGTHIGVLSAILAEGIDPMARHHVHLTTDLDLARKVGGRRGKSAVFTINTLAMVEDGYQFYCSDNGVWLVDHVPTQYLQLL
jgi:putative RNA 2'-phosphotransferase